MKREILNFKPKLSGCPGHNDYPSGTFKNRRSKRARSRDKKLEHKHARSIVSRELKSELLQICDFTGLF